MNSPSRSDTIEDLLLEEALDPSVSREEIEQRLHSAGIDTGAILKTAKILIGKAVRHAQRQILDEQNMLHRQRFSKASAEVSSWTMERVRAWLTALARGEHGPALQSLAQPCFRNRSSVDMSEEEVRNLAAEIRATMDSDDAT